MLVVASAAWFANIAFGFWRSFHDAVDGKRWQAVMGVLCVLGVNLVLGWMIYTALVASTDL